MTLYRDAKRFGKLPTEPGAELRWVVPVELDETKAADAFNTEMVRITGQSSVVEMRAIHAAFVAAVGEETP